MSAFELPIATITFAGDYRLACLQLLSADRLLDFAGLPEYTLIVNDSAAAEETSRGLQHFVHTSISSELREKIVIRQFSDILPKSTPAGYYDQQAIKLGLADYYADRLGASSWIMLDAKNHFVAPCSLGSFLSEGKPVSPRGKITPYWQRYVDASFEAMEAGSPPDFMLPSITPYFMYVDVAQATSRFLEGKFDQDLLGSIAASRGTEFLLYFAQLVKSELLERYVNAPLPVRTLFTSWPQDPELVSQMLTDLSDGKAPIFGLHRNRIPQLTSHQRNQILKLWQDSLGVQESEGEWFLHQ